MNLKIDDESMSIEKKWEIVQMREKTEEKTIWKYTPEETVKLLHKSKGKNAELIETLVTMLRTYSVEWGDSFISHDGHQLIFNYFYKAIEKNTLYVICII